MHPCEITAFVIIILVDNNLLSLVITLLCHQTYTSIVIKEAICCHKYSALPSRS